MIMIRRLLLLIGALVMLSGAEASENSRLNKEELDVDLVVQLIADFLWNKEFDSPRPFVIKGSYAASIWAQQHKPDLELPYNDIDVFVETDASNDKCPNKSGFVTSRYVKGIVPDTTVQITALCKLDANDLIQQSDINAVNVGFKVVPKSDENNKGVDDSMVPEIESWTWTTQFEKFVASQTLEVVYHNFIQHNVIRLLRKAQSMNMKYKFPDNLLEEIHGKVVRPNYLRTFNSLDAAYKSEITSRFDLVSIPEHDDWTMFTLKGRDIPEPPRRFLGATSDGYGYQYGFGGGNSTTTSATSESIFTTFVKAAVPAVVVALMA